MVVTLKDFCLQTGFPHKMIKSLANTGILPHWRQGRMYLFDKESTMQKLEMLKAVPIYTPQRAKKERCRNVNKLPEQYASRTEYLKALIKQRKNRCSGNCNG